MTRRDMRFMPVFDSRKVRVKGIYRRGDRWYGCVWAVVEGKADSRKYALRNPDGSPVDCLSQARAALERLRVARDEAAGLSRGVKQGVGFDVWAARYLASPITALKKPGTQELERQALKRWVAFLGRAKLGSITAAAVRPFVEARLRVASARTVNIDLGVLRNVLRAAVAAGDLREVPPLRRLEHKPRGRRPLLSGEEFARLLAAVPRACRKHPEQVADYLRFLAYSGAREQEGIRVQWGDVDFAGGRVWIGRDTKNHEGRYVEMNAQLRAVLEEMEGRRVPGSRYLFPSVQRGARDAVARTLRGSLVLAREAAGLPWVGFHDLRHFFASWAVMSGIDFMTVAEWLGHKDRGLLVAKVYGHLAAGHKSQMAAKLAFGAPAAADPAHEKARGAEAPGLEGLEWL